jgi:hypothetical protein
MQNWTQKQKDFFSILSEIRSIQNSCISFNKEWDFYRDHPNDLISLGHRHHMLSNNNNNDLVKRQKELIPIMREKSKELNDTEFNQVLDYADKHCPILK